MSLRNIVRVCVFPLQSDRNNIFWFDRRMKSRNDETKRCKKCPIAYQNIGDNCECLVWANIMVFRVVKRVSLSLQAQWKMWKIRYANEALCVVTKTTRLQKKTIIWFWTCIQMNLQLIFPNVTSFMRVGAMQRRDGGGNSGSDEDDHYERVNGFMHFMFSCVFCVPFCVVDYD